MTGLQTPILEPHREIMLTVLINLRRKKMLQSLRSHHVDETGAQDDQHIKVRVALSTPIESSAPVSVHNQFAFHSNLFLIETCSLSSPGTSFCALTVHKHFG